LGGQFTSLRVDLLFQSGEPFVHLPAGASHENFRVFVPRTPYGALRGLGHGRAQRGPQ
jgi:hypothetical protein